MFETEILRYLNVIKAKDSEHKTTVAKREISKLIKENPSDYKRFMQNPYQETWVISVMKDCEEASKESSLEDMTDIDIVKKAYSQWLEHYERNNRIPNEECEKIILKIIDYYINRFYILEQILKIDDTQTFEDFKNMLRNYIRKHFADEVIKYMDSSSYKSKSFWERRKKGKQIDKILENLGQYKFDANSIKEVLV